MQVQQVIRTINWIRDSVRPVEEDLFAVLPEALGPRDREGNEARMMLALHQLGAIIQDVRENPDAVQVLDAFGLSALHDNEFLVDAFRKAISKEKAVPATYQDYYKKIITPWRHMVSCVGPLSSLTLPIELQSADDPSLLNVDVSNRAQLTPELIIDVLKATAGLYGAISRIHSGDASAGLAVIKIESGTKLTISFKGVADIVREVKDLVVEMWNKHRHKRPEEIINHNRAIASSIQVLTEIEDRVKKHTLQPEDGERLKRLIVHNTLTLFKDGALISDIPPIEIVRNVALLNDFSAPKQLASPARDESTETASDPDSGEDDVRRTSK